MAQIDEKQIEEIVSQVLRTLQQDGTATRQPATSVGVSSSSLAGVFGTATAAIAAAKPHKRHLSNLGLQKDARSSKRSKWYRSLTRNVSRTWQYKTQIWGMRHTR